jgi:hypothetical protein
LCWPRTVTAARTLALAAALLLAGCEAGTSDGYSVSAPNGWKDKTDTAETHSGEDFQVVYEGPEDDGVPATIAIDREETPEGQNLARVTRAGRDRLVRRLGNRVTAGPLRPTRLAGEPAAGFDFDREDARVRQIGAIHGGHVYGVTFTASRGAFARRLPVLERLLDSWRWD